MDVEISCDGDATLTEAHHISQHVHDAIELHDAYEPYLYKRN